MERSNACGADYVFYYSQDIAPHVHMVIQETYASRYVLYLARFSKVVLPSTKKISVYENFVAACYQMQCWML